MRLRFFSATRCSNHKPMQRLARMIMPAANCLPNPSTSPKPTTRPAMNAASAVAKPDERCCRGVPKESLKDVIDLNRLVLMSAFPQVVEQKPKRPVEVTRGHRRPSAGASSAIVNIDGEAVKVLGPNTPANPKGWAMCPGNTSKAQWQ